MSDNPDPGIQGKHFQIDSEKGYSNLPKNFKEKPEKKKLF